MCHRHMCSPISYKIARDFTKYLWNILEIFLMCYTIQWLNCVVHYLNVKIKWNWLITLMQSFEMHSGESARIKGGNIGLYQVWITSFARSIWLNVNVTILILLYDLVPSYNLIWKYITGNHMLTSSYIFSGVVSSKFVSDVYILIQNILYLIFLDHTVMWLCHWFNTVLSHMGHYMEFHICMHNYFWAWLYLQPCSGNELFLRLRRYYFYFFVYAFSDVLIPNTPYILLG